VIGGPVMVTPRGRAATDVGRLTPDQ
jgi:hypothetical protein